RPVRPHWCTLGMDFSSKTARTEEVASAWLPNADSGMRLECPEANSRTSVSEVSAYDFTVLHGANDSTPETNSWSPVPSMRRDTLRGGMRTNSADTAAS